MLPARVWPTSKIDALRHPDYSPRQAEEHHHIGRPLQLIEWRLWLAPAAVRDWLCVAFDDHQQLVLILARNLVTNLAMPALLTDADGRLIFFNEAAALILGQSFEEVGRLRRDEWAARFGPFHKEGHAVAVDTLPLAVACARDAQSRAAFESVLTTSG